MVLALLEFRCLECFPSAIWAGLGWQLQTLEYNEQFTQDQGIDWMVLESVCRVNPFASAVIVPLGGDKQVMLLHHVAPASPV